MIQIEVKDILIDAEIQPNGKCVKLKSDYEVTVDETTIVVPKGFMSDFASVPRFLWPIISPWGLHSGAALVHDYLYTKHHYAIKDGALHDCKQFVTKSDADYIFLKLMLHLGVSPVRAKIMYWAVKLFGGSSWKKQGK